MDNFLKKFSESIPIFRKILYLIFNIIKLLYDGYKIFVGDFVA